MQFHPNVQDTETLACWVNDLSRNAYFTYLNSDTDTYNGLEMMNFQIAPYMMLDQWENPDNVKYNTEIGGTSNMATVLQAPVLASKGHYYQFSQKDINKTALIYDNTNTLIAPDSDRDDTYLGIEKISGVNV